MHLVGEEGRISVVRIAHCPRTAPGAGLLRRRTGNASLSRAIFDLLEDRAGQGMVSPRAPVDPVGPQLQAHSVICIVQ
jgi:hypothetical protein